MSKFDSIRPFYDAEINAAIQDTVNHPMMKALMDFTFPDVDDAVWKEQLRKTHSIRDFQCNFIYQSLKKDLSLSEREYNCDNCGLSIDRDINAAINIRNECMSKYTVTTAGIEVCGESTIGVSESNLDTRYDLLK